MKLPLLVPVTVSETVVLCVMLPLVPVTVMVYVPAAALEPTVIDIVDVPAPAIEAGLNTIVTPVGRPDADKVTPELKPPDAVTVIVDDPLLPSATDTELGEAEMEKFGVVLVEVSALMSPAPFGLPHPVTKS